MLAGALADFIGDPCRATAQKLFALHEKALGLGTSFPETSRAIGTLLPEGVDGVVRIAVIGSLTPKLTAWSDTVDGVVDALHKYKTFIRGETR
jgi:hypothetical protein